MEVEFADLTRCQRRIPLGFLVRMETDLGDVRDMTGGECGFLQSGRLRVG